VLVAIVAWEMMERRLQAEERRDNLMWEVVLFTCVSVFAFSRA